MYASIERSRRYLSKAAIFVELALLGFGEICLGKSSLGGGGGVVLLPVLYNALGYGIADAEYAWKRHFTLFHEKL